MPDTTTTTGPWHWECDDCATVAHAASRNEALALFSTHLLQSTDGCIEEAMLMYRDGLPGFQS